MNTLVEHKKDGGQFLGKAGNINTGKIFGIV